MSPSDVPNTTSGSQPNFAESQYELLVRSVVDYAIFMLDPQGRVVSWNPGAERIKGYGAEDIIGQHFSRFYTEEDRAAGRPERALRTAAEQGRFEDEAWRVRKDGTRFWAMVVIDAIRDEAGELIGFAKVTRDITERREAQQRLAEAREQLFQAQKVEAMGQLTGGLAHDFNNLLGTVMTAASLILRLDDNDRIKELAGHIRMAAQRGAELTQKLLAFARRQPLDPKTLDVREQLPAAVSLLRHSLGPEIDLVTELSDRVWPVEADPTQLQLAVLNLAFNARDAMPNGGILRIGARNVTLTGEPDGLVGDYVLISVSDTGTGIPEEIRDRIFEPFFTTKGFGQGTGLGLSQVFGFTKQSKGTVTVGSGVGTGTVLTLYLPAGLSAGDQAARARVQSAMAGRAKILVVDDDTVLAGLAAQLLEEMGHEPHVVHSGQEALEFVARHQQPDLVFADIIMPGGMSGIELARKVRTRFPECPILLTTGYSTSLGDNTSEFPLLFKPYEFDTLAPAVNGVLGRPDDCVGRGAG